MTAAVREECFAARTTRILTMTEETNNSGCSLLMSDKRLRAIAALEVELAMTELHAKKLTGTALSSADPDHQDAMKALIKEENERAEQLRHKIRLLRDQS